MPGLDACFPAVVEAARALVPPESLPGEAEPWIAGLQAYLAEILDARRAGRVLDVLRDAGWLDRQVLPSVEPAEMVEALRSAGIRLPDRTIRPLLAVARALIELTAIGIATATEVFRDRLRSIRGVGPGTADAVLLHGLGRPVFPVDRGGYRVLARHGWIDTWAEYGEASDVVTAAAQGDVAALRDLTGGLAVVASRYCKPRRPDCERCPLRPWLPERGPIEADSDEG